MGFYHFASFTLGLKDVDCEDNQLCCFDGSINACYMAGRGNEKKIEFAFIAFIAFIACIYIL